MISRERQMRTVTLKTGEKIPVLGLGTDIASSMTTLESLRVDVIGLEVEIDLSRGGAARNELDGLSTGVPSRPFQPSLNRTQVNGVERPRTLLNPAGHVTLSACRHLSSSIPPVVIRGNPACRPARRPYVPLQVGSNERPPLDDGMYIALARGGCIETVSPRPVATAALRVVRSRPPGG
jgi:hypothetical protein